MGAGFLALAVALSACEPAIKLNAEEASGQRLYAGNCQSCHGGKNQAIDSAGLGAPPHNSRGHTWHHPDQMLTTIILRGSEVTYGRPGMPAFQGILSEEEVQAILSYVKTWWTEEERAVQQRATDQVRAQQG